MAESEGKISYFSRKETICPVCETHFHREELLTGRGRLNAGDLTDELRRIYLPTEKYGEVYPLIYVIPTCPSCYYSLYPEDFAQIPDAVARSLHENMYKRIESVEKIFPSLDFSQNRGLQEGAASYFLSVMCYDYLPKDFAPTFKRGLSSLRAAWLSYDLHKEYPDENYDYLGKVFYRKARFFYNLAVEREQNGSEAIGGIKNMGPGIDKNYGYDGVLYITGLLEYRYGPRDDKEKRIAALDYAKRTLAKIFGMGKASKNKPIAILDNARDIYNEISKELETLGVKENNE